MVGFYKGTAAAWLVTYTPILVNTNVSSATSDKTLDNHFKSIFALILGMHFAFLSFQAFEIQNTPVFYENQIKLSNIPELDAVSIMHGLAICVR